MTTEPAAPTTDRFADHFSGHAEAYARHRPTYPAALFAFLAEHASRHERAWDCATGNGQAALALAAHFDAVVATDASADQLTHAVAHPRVSYRCAKAEEGGGLTDASVDLVTVAAAVHWFDLERFYRAIRRIARPGALVAVWTYRPKLEVSPEVDAQINDFAEQLAPHWPPQIARWVQPGYATLPFPFDEMDVPRFSCLVEWDLEQLRSHLRTWSGAQAHLRATGEDAVDALAPRLAEAWKPAPTEVARPVRFPLHLRVGRV